MQIILLNFGPVGSYILITPVHVVDTGLEPGVFGDAAPEPDDSFGEDLGSWVQVAGAGNGKATGFNER